jgi:hypothetical protein
VPGGLIVPAGRAGRTCAWVGWVGRCGTALAMVVRFAVRLEVKLREGFVAGGGHKMGGGSLGMERPRAEDETAMKRTVGEQRFEGKNTRSTNTCTPAFLAPGSLRFRDFFCKIFGESFGDPVFCHTPSVS